MIHQVSLFLFFFILIVSRNLSYQIDSFDINTFNVDNDPQYHESASDIEARMPNGSWLLKNDVVTFVPWTKVEHQYTYYDKGIYKYGAQNYTPSYVDSILLSA